MDDRGEFEVENSNTYLYVIVISGLDEEEYNHNAHSIEQSMCLITIGGYLRDTFCRSRQLNRCRSRCEALPPLDRRMLCQADRASRQFFP